MLTHCSKPQIFCLKKLNLKKILKPLAFLRKNKIKFKIKIKIKKSGGKYRKKPEKIQEKIGKK